MSPEHERLPNNSSSAAGTTFDEAIIRDVFTQTAEAAKILGVDSDFQKEILAKQARLVPYQIGKAGQLQEWMQDWDVEAPDQQHRYISHLYGLFPYKTV